MGGEDKERTTQPLLGLLLKMAEASTNCSPTASYSSWVTLHVGLNFSSTKQTSCSILWAADGYQNVIWLGSLSHRRVMMKEWISRGERLAETTTSPLTEVIWHPFIAIIRIPKVIAARSGKDWWSTVWDEAGNSILSSGATLHSSGVQL